MVSSLEAAIAASDNGIAKTLDGLSIGKTAAKNDWRVGASELETLSPVDPSKKLLKYHLADVIRLANNKQVGHPSEHLRIRIKQKKRDLQQQLYARYLHDTFLVARSNLIDTLDDEDESEAIINAAYEEVRKKTNVALKSKKEAVKMAQVEFTREQSRLSALDDLVDDAGDGGGKKKAASSKKVSSAVVNENVANDSKKPAAKKRKGSIKKKAKASEEDEEYESSGDELLKKSSGLSKRSRRNKTTISNADENSEDDM